MQEVTVSPKYQVVIPKQFREALSLTPGEKLQVFLYQNRLEFVRKRDIKSMRGFLKGINTEIKRDKDRL